MDFANRPITEFYSHCLSAARDKGYRWVVTLVAREADVDKLYHNLRQSWSSLDSITGKHFLFIFAGKENHTHEERWNSKVLDASSSWIGEYNDFVTFMNPNTELTASPIQYGSAQDKDKNMQNLEENQTAAINALRDYFKIDESDIPCLVFTNLAYYGDGTVQIVPISGDDIYGYFKHLFNAIDPRLQCITVATMRLQELSSQKNKLKNRIEQLSLSPDAKIVALQSELLAIAQKGVVDATGRSLFDCINSLSYGKFNMPLRGMLNKYVDLAKNYEKRTGRHFDCNSIDASESKRAIEKIEVEAELSIVSNEINELGELCGELIAKIEEIIGGSRMDKKSKVDSRLSVSVTGGTVQLNAAFDKAKIEATQTVGINERLLAELVGRIRETLPSNLSPEETDVVNANLDVIEKELKQEKPRKSFLNATVSGLQAIKGTAEFGAAIVALFQFVQTMP